MLPPKIALVHDWLNQLGGAEDVLEALVRLFPGAPVYTSIYVRDRMPPSYRAWDIRPSFLDRLPLIHSHHQPYLPFYPLAFERLGLSGYDLILSNKSGFCHGVQAGSALHICYCLTPTRYVWGFDEYAAHEGLGPAARLALRPLLARLKRWDRAAADRVHYFIAISGEVQARIRRFYERESAVIHPPVDTRRFQPAASSGDYYLSLGRLIPYKRADLAVQACSALGRRLIVAGTGRDRSRLERLAGPGVEFRGWAPDEDVSGLMSGCRAFLFPGLEDFGIAPVQAMAAGRPVIAFAGGGALDTVVDGVTGVLFNKQTPEALAEAIRRFETQSFDPEVLRRHARTFDTAVFEQKLTAFVEERYQRHLELKETQEHTGP